MNAITEEKPAKTIYFITANQDKLKEAVYHIPEIVGHELELPEIQSLDPKAVLEDKLNRAKAALPEKCILVEDTSLRFIKAGKGLLPGPLIKWYLNNFSLREIAEDLIQKGQTAALAASIVGFYHPAVGKNLYFQAEISGQIVLPRGNKGFGWDLIFVPQDSDNTYGEMDFSDKQKISMRCIAFRKLKSYLDVTTA